MKIYILLWGDMPWESCAANPSHLLSLLQQKLQAHPQKSTLLLMAVCCFTGVKEKKECGFSQSWGVTEAGRDLWASSSPTYAQSRASHSSFPGLNSCKDGKSTTSLDSQCQLSDTLTKKKKKYFLCLNGHFLNFNMCPSPLVLSLDTTENLALSLHPPTRHLYSWIKSPSLGWLLPAV